MKIITFILLTGALLISGCAEKTKHAKSKFIKESKSRFKIEKTIEVINKSLTPKNYKLISTFDHEKEALKLKKMLYPTKTLEFSNTKIETTLISCNPSMSLELPIRVAVYNELNGQTHITYTDPEYWSLKHNIKDSKCIKLIILLKQDLAEAVKQVEVKSTK